MPLPLKGGISGRIFKNFFHGLREREAADRLQIEIGFDLQHTIKLGMRFGIGGHEKRAAIFKRLRGNFEGAELACLLDDVLLVIAGERAQHGQRRNLIDYAQIRKRLAGDL